MGTFAALLGLNEERKLYCSVVLLITDLFILNTSHSFLQQAFRVPKKASRNCKFLRAAPMK